jgi:Tol biopolymer transport system component
MAIAIGKQLGSYEITALLGKGGMGEVYRARDTKLKREVAIKVLPDESSLDPDRVSRFQREAQLLASLNHPNIAQIYGLEQFGNTRCILMELVDGETLQDRLTRGPFSVSDVLPIATQIVDALEAAHEKGIIHRDLKPANIKFTSDGKVKVLDFGLAKAFQAQHQSTLSNSPTLVSASTPAAILGTVAYMSPEQAKGKEADRASDVWAFGCVLYEMVTGRRLHQGESATEVLASVMKDEPLWDKVPFAVRKLLRKCLEKDPQKRPRHIGDVMLLVDEAPAALTVMAAPTTFKKAALWAVLGAALGIAAMIGWTSFRTPPPALNTTRFQIPLPEKGDFGQYLLLSPNGRRLVFNTTGPEGGLWVRDLDTLTTRLLPGTQNAARMFWSPDSRFVAFSVGNQLKKIDVSGGPVQTLCEVSNPLGSGAWSKYGVIIFGGAPGPIRKVSQNGGVPTDLTTGGELHTLPSFLPDGRHFVYHRAAGSSSGMYLGSIDATPADQLKEMLLSTLYAAIYVPSTDSSDGHVFFLRDGTLVAQTFDAVRFKLTGEPIPIAERIGTGTSHGFFSISANGVLAYRTGIQAAGLQLTWFDRQGKILGEAGEPAAINQVVLSPDASRVATVRTAGQEDIWLLDFARSVTTRFTFEPRRDNSPVWSPDGNRIVFQSGSVTVDDLYQKPSDGASDEQLLLKSEAQKIATSWSHDGRFLLYATRGLNSNYGIWILPMAWDNKPVPWLVTPFNERSATFSPDMRWIAYLSDESGRPELYVRPFTPPGSESSATSGKWQVSKDGAAVANPKWRADGKEIIFRAPGGSPMAVDVIGSGPAFQAGIPKQLFPAQPTSGPWDVTADGKRFLMAVPPGQQNSYLREPITVVMNWQTALKK